MDIKLLDNNRLEIGTNSYIQEGVRGFDEEVYTKVSSPENKNLRKVNLDSPILPKEQAEDFYSVVENLLWTTKLAWPYVETEVAFLFNQVKSPAEQEKIKLKRLLQFLNQTIDYKRVIGAD